LIAGKFAKVYIEAGFLLQKIKICAANPSTVIHVAKKTSSNSFAIAFSKT
jgi:hypothetical protein